MSNEWWKWFIMVKILKIIWLIVFLYALSQYIYLIILTEYYDYSVAKAEFVRNTILFTIIEFPIGFIGGYIKNIFFNYDFSYKYLIHIFFYIINSILNYILLFKLIPKWIQKITL